MGDSSRKPHNAGVAAVELAIILPIFLLLIFGILEFGHAWYIKYTITNASREGARYGTVYRIDPATNARQSPLKFTPSIGDMVNVFLLGFYTTKFWDVPTPTLALGSGTVIPGQGNDLTVTVTAPKHWILLGDLVGLEDVTIEASTTMKLE